MDALWYKLALAGEFFTHGKTSAASQAAVGTAKHLILPSLSFGIVAPGTAKGASLQKDGGTDTGTVKGGKFFNAENSSYHCKTSFHLKTDLIDMIMTAVNT